MENSMGVSLKTKSYFIVLLPYFIVVLFLDIYLKKKKKTEKANWKRYIHPGVHRSIIYNCQDMEAPSTSFNRWMDREDAVSVHIHNGVILSHKKRIKFCHLQQHGWTWNQYKK